MKRRWANQVARLAAALVRRLDRRSRIAAGYWVFLAILPAFQPCRAASVGRVDLSSLLTPIYTVDGNAFVRRNGDRYFNRPLYCNHINAVVLAGDKPLIRLGAGHTVSGTMMFALLRGGKGKWFADASDIESRYECGRMDWTIRDRSWGDTSFHLETLPTATGPGMAVRIQIDSAQANDQLLIACGGLTQTHNSVLAHFDVTTEGRQELMHRGFSPEDCSGNTAPTSTDGWTLSGSHNSQSIGQCDAPGRWFVADASAWRNPTDLIQASTNQPLACGLIPLDRSEIFLTLSPTPLPQSPQEIFQLGLHRVNSIENQVVVNTPDPWLNAAVSASCSVIDGLYRNGMYTHAGMRWSVPLIGWRVIYAGTAYGWHQNVLDEAKRCIARQITQSDKTEPVADPERGLASQSSASRMFGVGRINIDQPEHYDMQSQFFDQIQHAWRWTGDPKLERLLGRSLDLHCRYLQQCFDPSQLGIYESYANTWPTDDQWYNGGGTSEETAYAYRAEKTAMELAMRAGNETDEQCHAVNLARIRKGFFNLLWNSRLGHPGAYREQGGLNRLHDSCWLYSVFCPIDAGLLDAEQAAEALYYTDWGLERIQLPYGGEQCWPSNWVPSIWSVREMWPGDNYALALAYFQTGLADDGWKVLRGTFPQQLLFGSVPGDLGHPAGATDFGDCASPFCRTVVEGLFGYTPDYPNHAARFSPQLPSDWKNASIKTPDFSFAFQRTAAVSDYQITLTHPADIELDAPVCTTQILSVIVNGAPAKTESLPGFGTSIVKVQIPHTTNAEVRITCGDAVHTFPARQITANVGDPLNLTEDGGTILDVHDPQNVLSHFTISNWSLAGTVATNPGDHLLFALTQLGDTRQWREIKIHVTDTAGDAVAAAKLVSDIPKNAKWESIDMQSAFNGDIRMIYQQQYLSPRPNTCSLRLATDGYGTWQMVLSPRYHPPQIGLENATNPIVTGRGVPFAFGGGSKNIAFTSRWDNWPHSVSVPVNRKGDAVFFLLCGSTNPMEVQIANAELRMEYSDGVVEKLEIVPPMNFWTLCPIDGMDYNYQRDAFCLPKQPPETVQLGQNCRAIVLNWRLRPGVELKSVRLETLSQQVVIGLMSVSVLNPREMKLKQRISTKSTKKSNLTSWSFVPFVDALLLHAKPSCNIAASDILSFDQGGSQVSSTSAPLTSGIDSTFRSTSPGNDPATGQAGEVSVIFTFTNRLSSISMP